MINVNIITIGKLKEQYFRDAVSEYEKRLGAFCKLTIKELPESRLGEKPSQKEIISALNNEAISMSQFCEIKGAFNISMCIEGKMLDSEALSKKFNHISVNGFSTINFFIGSSFGLSEDFKAKTQMRFSMSPMTFPHQLARVMLIEQIYRAFSILSNGKYHK